MKLISMSLDKDLKNYIWLLHSHFLEIFLVFAFCVMESLKNTKTDGILYKNKKVSHYFYCLK